MVLKFGVNKAPTYVTNSDLSDMAKLPLFSPPAQESTLEYRTEYRVQKSTPTGPYEAQIIRL